MVELLLNTITLPAYHQQEAWVWTPIIAIVTTVVVSSIPQRFFL